MNLVKDRNGQITVFVLIGLLIVLVVAGGIYLVDDQPSDQDGESTSFSEDITPITNQIRSCADTLVNERVRELALQGGLTDEETNSLQSSATRQSHRLEGVDYYGDGEVIVPYWSYSSDSPDCSTCTTKTDIVPLNGENSFQEKTEAYVEENVRRCMKDFEDFNDTFEVSAETPRATVQFNEQDTTTRLEWDITVTERESQAEYNIDEISVASEIPLEPLYETAIASLRKIETEQLPTEYVQKILSYLSLDNTIPPVRGGTQLGLDNSVWILENVRSQIRSRLANYASLINVIGSNQAAPTYTSESIAQFASDFTLVTTNESTAQYQIDATYRPTWPLFLRVDGSTSPVITPDSTSFGLKFFRFAFSNQDFTYDVSYPLVMELTDRNLRGDALTLRYGVEGNIRNTQSYDERVYDYDEDTGSTADFTGLGETDVNITIDGPTSEQGYVELSCVGETIPAEDRTPETPAINTDLPTCSNGELTYQASLLDSETKNVTIRPNQQNSFTLRTNDLQTYNVTVQRRPVFDATKRPVPNPPNAEPEYPELPYDPTPFPGVADLIPSSNNNVEGMSQAKYVPADTLTDPLDQENVTVVLSQVDGDYAATKEFTNETTKRQVELFPGEYRVQAFSEYDLEDPIQTEEEEICVSGEFAGIDVNEQCQTIPSQTMPDGQANAVRRCVAEQTDDESYQAFTEDLANSDQDALTVAQNSGIDVEGCVDQRLENMDMTLTTGGFAGQNTTTLQMNEGDQEATITYFGYRPNQIVHTRDMKLMAAPFQLPEQTKTIDALQPQVD